MKITCRICKIQHGEFFTLDSEISFDTSEQQLLEIFNKCLQLDAELEDSLPHYLCSNCIDKLKELYTFQLIAVKSDLEFREGNWGYEVKVEAVTDIITVDDGIKKEEEETPLQNEYMEDEIKEDELSLLNEDVDIPSDDDAEILGFEACDNPEEKQDDYENLLEQDDEEDLEDTDILFELYSKNDAFIERYPTEESQDSIEEKYITNDNVQQDLKKNELLNVTESLKNENVVLVSASNNIEIPKKSLEPQAIEITRLQLPVESKNVQTFPPETLIEPRKYSCEDCGRKYVSEFKLEQHREQQHTRIENCQCEICDSTFITIYDYREHMKIHGEERKFSCEFCDKTFMTRANLKNHLTCHTNLRPFKCEECGKTFQQKSILKTHMTLHVGKPIKCSLCDLRFSRSAHLKVHMRQHNNERPYKCPKCPSSYTQKSHLDRHIASTHLGVRYQCTICGKMYTKKPSLDTHIRDSHTACADGLYSCQICGLDFPKQKGLYYHLKTKHPDHQKIKI